MSDKFPVSRGLIADAISVIEDDIKLDALRRLRDAAAMVINRNIQRQPIPERVWEELLDASIWATNVINQGGG